MRWTRRKKFKFRSVSPSKISGSLFSTSGLFLSSHKVFASSRILLLSIKKAPWRSALGTYVVEVALLGLLVRRAVIAAAE